MRQKNLPYESVDIHAIGVSSDSDKNQFRIVRQQVDQAARVQLLLG
jgi:hypothetical protein